jgi:hypothetical protein
MPITLNGTTGEIFPTWTTAGRPATPSQGQTGYNTTLNILETYNGSAWLQNINTITPGTILQVVNYQTGAVATGTTQIPSDDTIPQNTEGDEYMTLAITPKSATSKLKIDVLWFGECSAAGTLTMALFQDSTANALAATAIRINASAYRNTFTLVHYMTSGTTSSTTFKIRCGLNAAATTTFNGATGARLYGGVIPSSITIMEIAA